MEEKLQNKGYIIPIKGLSAGKHNYDFSLDRSFFESFENSFINDADIKADIEIEKGAGWMRLNADIHGSVTVECDRCLDDLIIPVNVSAPLQIKFSKTHFDEDDISNDEFLIMDPSDAELDVSQFLYDYVCISLPLKKVHKDGECNEDMVRKLAETNFYEVEPDCIDGENNSPFGNLKKMLDDKK